LDFKVSSLNIIILRHIIIIIKVKVEQKAIDYVEQLYAPPNDPVFELVPATFAHYTQIIYNNMSSPVVTGENVWDIYRELVKRLEELEDAMDYGDYLDCIDQWEVNEDLMEGADEELPYLLIDGQDLRGGYENPREDGTIYLGGVNGGDGLGMFLHFTV
jgi:hypothetical protein